MPSSRTVHDVVDAHRAAGSSFRADGVGSFALSEGVGDPVLLIHGLPASSFLYRKVVPELAARGMRAVAFDLPGLGFADRPTGFDYSLRGLGAFSAAAVDALDLGRFHLVVHDAGGPVGFDLVSRMPDRIRSLTILNTMVAVGKTPFPGEVYARFSRRLKGPMTAELAWRELLYRVGIADRSAVPVVEVDAYRELALMGDSGAGYLEIMRRVRDDGDNARFLRAVDSRTAPYPVSLVWGGKDPILTMRRFAWDVLRATGLPSITVLPGKHYLQEDQAPAIADLVAANAGRA